MKIKDTFSSCPPHHLGRKDYLNLVNPEVLQCSLQRARIANIYADFTGKILVAIDGINGVNSSTSIFTV